MHNSSWVFNALLITFKILIEFSKLCQTSNPVFKVAFKIFLYSVIDFLPKYLVQWSVSSLYGGLPFCDLNILQIYLVEVYFFFFNNSTLFWLAVNYCQSIWYMELYQMFEFDKVTAFSLQAGLCFHSNNLDVLWRFEPWEFKQKREKSEKVHVCQRKVWNVSWGV